jgi:class 3 adenylate cyclase/pimeloyl-ACP methyl ester carboxylesterase
MDVPEVRYADAGGVSIAWQQFGHGPDVLAIPPLVSNVELIWEHEYNRRFLEYAGRYLRFTVFDKRGVGLSDRFADPPTLEERTEDILAVLDAAGLDTVTLEGLSEGGLMAQLFAAQHPERVDRLVLGNSSPGASGFSAVHTAPDGSLAPLEEKLRLFERLVETWGRDPQFMVDWFNPVYSGDASFVRWIGRFQRQSATAADIGRQLASVVGLDAVDHLGDITAPTLIFHGSGDRVIPVAAARYLGDRIAGSTVVEWPTDDHFAFSHPGWQDICDLLIEFVVGSRPTRQAERRVQTVVFTDIVGSTPGTAAAGDEAWHRLLDDHDRISWATAGRHRGTIVKSTGDGLLARFDSPSNALAFASEFRQALDPLGLQIRCGLHTGEIEMRDNGDITGIAVNLAARVEQACDDGAIFVSSTVCDLMMGSDAIFDDRGQHTLKGFDRPWRLFSLVSHH